MPQESMGGTEAMGGTDTRVIASGTALVAAGATVTLATLVRRPGEQLWCGGWPMADVAGLAVGEASGFTLWLERTAVGQQFTLEAKNAAGADRSLEWWVRGAL